MRSKGDHVGPLSVDRGRPGSKHRLICDAGGIPPAVRVTGGNRHDVTHLIPLIEAIPPIRGRRGRPAGDGGRCSPTAATATASIAGSCALVASRRASPAAAWITASGLGRQRWVAERGFAWLHAFKRLRTSCERGADIHLGLLQLACALIC